MNLQCAVTYIYFLYCKRPFAVMGLQLLREIMICKCEDWCLFVHLSSYESQFHDGSDEGWQSTLIKPIESQIQMIMLACIST